MRRRGTYILVALAVTAHPWWAARPAMADAAESSSRVRAAFVCNFTQFVGWPAEASGSDNGQFVLGVLCGGPDANADDDAFCDTLTHLAAGKSAAGHPITVKRVTSVDDAAACQALYVPASQDARLAALFAAAGGRPVLTIGESDAFATAGGVIRFVTAGGKVRFEVHTAAASRGRLRVSSKLLKVAVVVDH